MPAVAAPPALTIDPLSLDTVRPLLGPQVEPCLSLYLPTHRNVPDNTVDLPAFRHLVGGFEMALSATRPRDEIERLLHPFHVLAGDTAFWRHTLDGLAVLASDGRARIFILQRPVVPLAVVARRFHTMPLLRIASALERFHVLALTSREARLFMGTVWHDVKGAAIDALDPVLLTVTPGAAPTEAVERASVVDEEIFQPHRVKHGMGPAGLAGVSSVHGGAGSKRDDIDADTEIFLRHVDGLVAAQASIPGGLPLVLVAGPRLAATFRGLSQNPRLLEEHVARDPHLMSQAELTAAVTPVFATARERRIERELRGFAQACDRDLAATDLAEVGRAAVAGRIATLLVEADRFEPGSFDRGTGAVVFGSGAPQDISRTGGPAAVTEDVIGAVAETVLLHGGVVVALRRIQMPAESGVAAIYRY